MGLFIQKSELCRIGTCHVPTDEHINVCDSILFNNLEHKVSVSPQKLFETRKSLRTHKQAYI